MLKRRIIPCLDVKDGRIVKGVHFKGLRDTGDPIEAARAYDRQGADEITLISLQRSKGDALSSTWSAALRLRPSSP